jgi:hypothetical protein
MIGKNSAPFSLPFMGSTKARMRAKEDGGAQRSQGGGPYVRSAMSLSHPTLTASRSSLPIKGREKDGAAKEAYPYALPVHHSAAPTRSLRDHSPRSVEGERGARGFLRLGDGNLLALYRASWPSRASSSTPTPVR